MRYRNVPPELRDRLRRYFAARWSGRKIFREAHIMRDLPEPYVRSLLSAEAAWLSSALPLLAAAGEGFVAALVPRLGARLILEGERIVGESGRGRGRDVPASS